MYDYIKGTIEELSPAEMVVECSGIGYRIAISLNSYEKFKDCKETKVYIYHHIREEEEAFYGFYDKEERRIFSLLIGVSGIGPGTARMMLSSLTADEVCNAVSSADVNKIKGVKGIGLKTAQKLIIELKDKIARQGGSELDLGANDNNFAAEATAALINLGFAKGAVEKAVAAIIKKDGNLSLEEIIKKGLKLL